MKALVLSLISLIGATNDCLPQTTSTARAASPPPGNYERIERLKGLIKSTGNLWANGTFHPIADPTFPTNLSHRTIWIGFELPKHQQASLTSMVADLFRTYHSGAFDAYFRFRTNGFSHRLHFSKTAEQVIAYHTKAGVVFPSEPYARARRLWEVLCKTNSLGERPKLLAVDLDTVRIAVTNALDPRRPYTAERGRALLNNLSGTCESEIVSYSETPEGLCATNGFFQMAMLEAIVRFNTADLPGYIVASFYWSDLNHRWIPWRMTTDASSKFKVQF